MDGLSQYFLINCIPGAAHIAALYSGIQDNNISQAKMACTQTTVTLVTVSLFAAWHRPLYGLAGVGLTLFSRYVFSEIISNKSARNTAEKFMFQQYADEEKTKHHDIQLPKAQSVREQAKLPKEVELALQKFNELSNVRLPLGVNGNMQAQLEAMEAAQAFSRRVDAAKGLRTQMEYLDDESIPSFMLQLHSEYFKLIIDGINLCEKNGINLEIKGLNPITDEQMTTTFWMNTINRERFKNLRLGDKAVIFVDNEMYARRYVLDEIVGLDLSAKIRAATQQTILFQLDGTSYRLMKTTCFQRLGNKAVIFVDDELYARQYAPDSSSDPRHYVLDSSPVVRGIVEKVRAATQPGAKKFKCQFLEIEIDSQ
jgi:hypothetical protein